MADEAIIKTEPDTGGSPDAEDDVYEDAGDLEFYDPQSKRPVDFDNVYLARVPKYIWDAWNTLDDNAEIDLGTVRIIDGVRRLPVSWVHDGEMLTS